MKIDCYFSVGCTSDKILRRNIPEALAAEGLEVEVGYHRVSDEQAERMGLRGSPTILIDGIDPYPSEIDGFS